jgi:signal transduction histidine kinase
MRERIEALGGSLSRENRSGTRLTIEFPLIDDCPQ